MSTNVIRFNLLCNNIKSANDFILFTTIRTRQISSIQFYWSSLSFHSIHDYFLSLLLTNILSSYFHLVLTPEWFRIYSQGHMLCNALVMRLPCNNTYTQICCTWLMLHSSTVVISCNCLSTLFLAMVLIRFIRYLSVTVCNIILHFNELFIRHFRVPS